MSDRPWHQLGISEEEYDRRQSAKDPYYRSNRDRDPYYRTERDRNPYYREPNKDSTMPNPDGGAGW